MPEARAPERTLRLIIIGTAIAAVATMAQLGAREWPALVPLTAMAFGGTLALARLRFAAAAWLVLPLLYFNAALILAVVGHSRNAYQAPMLGAMLALALGHGFWRGWSLPPAWRPPLVWWSLVVASGAIVVVFREMDFAPALLSSTDRLASSGVGGNPASLSVWIGYVASTQLIGVLWFDAFFARYGSGDWSPFKREVLLPLGVGMSACAAIAIYQGLVDISWLSGHAWAAQGRAASGLIDGDAFGSLAGFWTGVWIVLFVSERTALRGAAAIAFAISWVGLWASGSRMALVAGVVSTGGAVLAQALPMMRRRPWRAIAGVAGTIAVIAALMMADFRWQTDSPLRRTLRSLPSPTAESVAHFAEHQLWNRDAPFGTSSMWMLHDYPFTGVGIASFNTLYPDYAYMIRGHYGVPENAQSWYRHVAAELGALGTAPVIWWVLAAMLTLFRPGNAGGGSARAVRAALIAYAIVSAVSMPSQNLSVALTFWPFMFAFVALSPRVQERWRESQVPSRAVWVTIVAATMVFVVATTVVGLNSLRPPMRAIRGNWTYSRGFEAQDQHGGQVFRWTRGHAVEVPFAPAAWMRVAIGGGPPDIASRPMNVTLRRNGEEIARRTLTDTLGQTWWVRVPTGPPRIMIEIEVDRTWSPRDHGGTDPRQLGVAVLPWVFADAPPRGATAIR